MEFGLLKSKIEKHLLESYRKDTFGEEIKIFKKIVLENKQLSKVFYLYDELNKNKGFDKSFAEEFLKESVEVFEKNKPSKKDIEILEWWVGDVDCQNDYNNIDVYLNKNDVVIENIINSKKQIIESLTKKEVKKEHVKLPIEKIVEVSNQTIQNYLNNLSESERNEIKKVISLNEEELKMKFDTLSEITINKLNQIKESSDDETKKSIDEVMKKIEKEEVSHINYVKLKELNLSL